MRLKEGERVILKNQTFPEGICGSAYRGDDSRYIVSTPIGAVTASPEELEKAPAVKIKAFTEKQLVSVNWLDGTSVFLELLAKDDRNIPCAMFEAAAEWNDMIQKSNLRDKEKYMVRKARDFTWVVIPNEICARHGFIFADSSFDMNVWNLPEDETAETCGGLE